MSDAFLPDELVDKAREVVEANRAAGAESPSPRAAPAAWSAPR